MISFYPGPSRVYPQITKWTRSAYEKGLLSVNHRSPEFERLYRKTITQLQKKLEVPESYMVIFTSSATECWEIQAQSLIERQSHHLYNGAFGEKWFRYTQRLRPASTGEAFSPEMLMDLRQHTVPDDASLIAITQNETANGTQIPPEVLTALREKYPDRLISVDATSSMAGVTLPWEAADIWYASVQKCFGLPAGMAVLLVSPAAIDKARELDELDHYNSLLFLAENARKHQTSYTPNVLGIYLLFRMLKYSEKIEKTDKKITERHQKWMDFLNDFKQFRPFVKNEGVRSKTIIALQSDVITVQEILDMAKNSGFILGKGYGKLKDTTFRIANFPAIQDEEIKKLQKFFKKHFN